MAYPLAALGRKAQALAHKTAAPPAYALAPEEIANEYARCLKDPCYFICHYAKILTRNEDASFTIASFVLWDYQARLVTALAKGGHHMNLKARQLGITTTICAYATWVLLFRQNSQVLLLSQTEPDANDLLTRVRDTYEHLPDWMRDLVPLGAVSNTHVMQFSNGSIARAQAATGNAGRSKTNSLVFVDEADKIADLEAVYGGVRPTVDGGGQMILASTATGPTTFFAHLWHNAIEYNIRRVFFPWWVRPGRTPEWYATNAKGPAHVRKREYPANPEEAFVSAEDLIYPTFSTYTHFDSGIRLEQRPAFPPRLHPPVPGRRAGLYAITRYGDYRITQMHAGEDFNNAVPGAVLVAALCDEGTVLILDGHYQANVPVVSADPDALTWATIDRELQRQYTFTDLWCDHDPENIASLAQAGLPAKKANKEVDPGISQVTAALERRPLPGDALDAPSGPPGLIIDARLTWLATEFASYKWQRIGSLTIDKPVKQNDHGLDALRYVLMGLKGGRPRIRQL